ncbi:hypothetical protein AB0N31_00880 [Streptomyces sp. NPDC051051]|uniref:hypothetical protein n=1 Tax=Streptomyces sp. NPDC051051 TaxID=3155666 RepID=UPI00341DEEB0
MTLVRRAQAGVDYEVAEGVGPVLEMFEPIADEGFESLEDDLQRSSTACLLREEEAGRRKNSLVAPARGGRVA